MALTTNKYHSDVMKTFLNEYTKQKYLSFRNFYEDYATPNKELRYKINSYYLIKSEEVQIQVIGILNFIVIVWAYFINLENVIFIVSRFCLW